MINLEYQEKDLKTLQMNIAPSSMTRIRYIRIYLLILRAAFECCHLFENVANFLPSLSFFYKIKVEVIEGGTFWLSESPSVPGSISWGALVPCIATWVISLPFAFVA